MKYKAPFLKKFLSNRKAILVLLFAILAATASYYYNDSREARRLLESPTAASQQEAKELSAKVGKLLETPPDEQPTVITVIDKEKVKTQNFFARAENGDKVLVYTAAKKAVLYRPSTNKIIEVGPVDLTPTKTFTVALYNASNRDDAIQKTEASLKERVTNLDFTVQQRASATRRGRSLVVDIHGDKPTEAEQLAEVLGAEVGPLPDGETKPDTDFLIIIAQ